MFFEIVTPYPFFFESFFKTGLMKRAINNGVLNYKVCGLRKYGEGKLKKIDDSPYGGVAGMLLKNTVLEKNIRNCIAEHVVLLSPRGKVLTQKKVKSLLEKKVITFICGHYEGIDQRFINRYVDEEISIGDYILVGGEVATQVIVEAMSRYIPGFMNNPMSTFDESFENGLLEYDQYTRPYTPVVPKELISGNHKQIEHWNSKSALINTYHKRPDLLKNKILNEKEEVIIKDYFYAKK